MLRATFLFIALLLTLLQAGALFAEDRYSVNRSVIVEDEEGNVEEIPARGFSAQSDYQPKFQSNRFSSQDSGERKFKPDFSPVYKKPPVNTEEPEYRDPDETDEQLKPVQNTRGEHINPYAPEVIRHPASNMGQFRHRQLNPENDPKPVAEEKPEESSDE